MCFWSKTTENFRFRAVSKCPEMVDLDQKSSSDKENDQFWAKNVRNLFKNGNFHSEMTFSEFKSTIFDEIAILKWKSLFFVKSERILKDKNGSSPDKSLTSAYTWSI